MLQCIFVRLGGLCGRFQDVFDVRVRDSLKSRRSMQVVEAWLQPEAFNPNSPLSFEMHNLGTFFVQDSNLSLSTFISTSR